MCAFVLGKGRTAKEADGNVFFSKQERLLNPCLLEQGGLEGGKAGRGCDVMPGIQVYGWPKEVSIIHKVRPPYAP